DNITVWLNPNLALTEAAQSPSLTTNFFANASFDEIRLREGGGGNGWTFSDIVIAGNSTDTGFFAVPEPSAALLGAFGLIGLLRRRK
ncbi:MAG: PEP-CTERM sorting domain-containing protein, partial [Verrucomicrobiae bacterium]|nr:PEP-CTERM sorting domain-containing protein [Verrucomicrobiae bacterium]